ncbi:major facilitator superfamily MFS_1 [Kribbella flavida DSM 17836]|uniref:Major facilitator superfamily MFS_1 n=1 Tax=Kribbella flavida (strain DSM 17836 / JCM 10339 / NBRC 14399) TaxID=479435 RepID=D2PR51_KRIFD|nr:MFS transporter [Kribbella flavida]ADB32999.1 major facilitator superfamily MFS_1 [Kribbella flavida DSM 17836]
MLVPRLSRTQIGLFALSVACFVSVTSENLPVALLSDLASEFAVPESAIGLLMTGYAAVVAVSVVPLVAWTGRWDRRTAVLVTLAAIVGSNLLLAIAPNYGVAVVARVVSAAGHGVFWSVVASMAARLLGPQQAGRATAVVFAGNSLAFLFGLPLSAWLGATVGWRFTVVGVAALAALAGLAIRVTIQPMPPERTSSRPGPAAVRDILTDRVLASINVTTVVAVVSHFVVFTYITVIIADYVHLSGAATSILLLAHGTAGLAGLLLIGRWVDSRPQATSLLVTGGLAVCMLTLLTLGHTSTAIAGTAVVLWALPAGGIGVVLQAAILRNAKVHKELASAVYIVAFQIGIALGAWIGGVGLDHGALPVAVAVALGGGLVATALVRRSTAFHSIEQPEHSSTR